MDIEFDKEKLQIIANDFYNTTGIGMYISFKGAKDRENISSLDYNPYCDEIRKCDNGLARCRISDKSCSEKYSKTKKPEIFICHGGLLNAVFPLVYDSDILGSITLCGFRDKSYSEVLKFIDDLEFDKEEMESFYNHLPVYEKKRFDSAVNLATILCEHIVFMGMVTPKSGENFRIAKAFIVENLDKNLSIEEVSKGSNISKSVLYRLFKQKCNCTVNEYINRKRVERAAEILLSTELSIGEVARKVGFKNVKRFRLVFKERFNTTPIKFKNSKSKTV